MGIIGVYGIQNAAQILYLGLHALQHRGQEGAGIATFEDDGRCMQHTGLGLAGEVLTRDIIAGHHGSLGIGSNKYANANQSGLSNVQPLVFKHHSGDFSITGEGNIINGNRIREELEDKGYIFHTSTDSEILAYLIKKQGPEDRIDNIIKALNTMDGGFSFLILTKNRIYACRDRYGLKPLALGKMDDGYIVSSETCAFDLIGAQFIRDIEPGEIICIDDKGVRSNFYHECRFRKMCAMEYIYIARPDSDIDGRNVHSFRKRSGKILAEECPSDADIVVGVPDSGLSAAQGYAERSGLPYEMGLVKNRYVARTFIQPTQKMRERGVQMKLSAVRSIVGGKRLVLVDDSIVRGTTCLKIVKMLRAAGAKEVHVRIASPMMTDPCYYGVDTSTREEVLCSSRTLEEARQAIEADTLGFISIEGTRKSTAGCSELCMACFGDGYPTSLYDHEENK